MKALLLLLIPFMAMAQDKPVYRCGNVYTDEKCSGAVVVKHLDANVLQAVEVPISEFRYRTSGPQITVLEVTPLSPPSTPSMGIPMTPTALPRHPLSYFPRTYPHPHHLPTPPKK